MEQQDKRLICSFSNKNIFLAPARQYVFESDPLTHYWERCWVAIEFQEKSASTNELAGCQITSNFATYSAIRTHLIFPPMLWKSIRCKLVFLKLDKIDWHWLEASSLHQATSLKSEKNYVSVSRSLVCAGSQHLVISTIFVDDERFLKNYNLKDLFCPTPKINRSLWVSAWLEAASFVYHIEPTYYIVTRCLFSLRNNFCTQQHIHPENIFQHFIFYGA